MMRLRTMGPLAALALGLAGCGPDPGPSWNLSSHPRAPNDSITVRRIMGQNPETEPLQTEPGRWATRENPRATLANPEQAMRDVPPYNPMPRPEVERSLPPPRAGSSTPPPMPGLEAIPDAPPARAPRAPAPVARDPLPTGSSVTLPDGRQGTVTGGTPQYRTYQAPNQGGGGVIIPQADGTGTVIGPDGRTMTVPLPR